MRDEETPYDQVLYPGEPFVQTHPDRLGTIASLFGMQPALASRCRVLELGCGIGGNLIPIACQNPESEFLGIDLSARQIEHGREAIAGLGLPNIRLEHGDIMQVTRALGEFDFIVAHGVYSWVPDPVRRKVLSICRENLAPQGVAFISFNAYPGCRRRDVARDLMQFHVRRVTDPQMRLKQGRAVLELFARLANDDVYGSVLKEQDRWTKGTSDAVVHHDDLAAIATPFLLHQVVDRAAEEGLQYLSEATFAHSSLGGQPAHFAKLLGQFPPEEMVAREQYLDFLVGRTFREALFCRAEVALRRTVSPSQMRDYWLATSSAIVPQPVDFAGDARSPALAITEHPAARYIGEAMRCLQNVWPHSIRFADLAEAAAQSASPFHVRHEDAEQILARTLFRAYRAGTLQLHLDPPPLAGSPSERPRASAVARSQARTTTRLVNLRHVTTDVTDNRLRRCLLLADGTRTLEQIAHAFSHDEREEGGADVTLAQVEHCLRELAQRCLLAA